MKLIFLGPPGAGKGTIADLAVEKLGLPHISTGDLFRAAVKNGTPLGLKVKDIMASGGLVPDELTIELVKERLAEKDAAKGWILDGFPRTIPQAEALEKIASVDSVVNFEVADEIVVGRLSGRRVCRTCGKIYHVEEHAPQEGGRLRRRRRRALHPRRRQGRRYQGEARHLSQADSSPDRLVREEGQAPHDRRRGRARRGPLPLRESVEEVGASGPPGALSAASGPSADRP